MNTANRVMYIIWVIYLALIFTILMVNNYSVSDTPEILFPAIFMGLAILFLIQGIINMNQNKKIGTIRVIILNYSYLQIKESN
ncbi:hypothetical protein [Oceanobacillus locisalsi]|uniref:Uncharacterized protein n=1 Tax=Oceanobacillus locisalsi TaxID=546107 RepID=A0ABW3NL70_9BACI